MRPKFFVVLFVLLIGIHFVTLTHFPPLFVDEAWNASRAWGFIHTGKNLGTLDAGLFEKYPAYATYFPLLPTLFYSALLQLFDPPSLLPMRLVSLFFGSVLLICAAFIARKVAGWRMAVLAVVTIAFSVTFSYSSHLARMDIMTAAFGFAAATLYWLNDRAKVWLSGLSGLLAALAVEIHLHGAIYAPAIGMLYIVDYKQKFWRQKHFWGYVAGGLLGGLIYLFIHILPSPASYQEITAILFSATHTPNLFTGDPHVILQGFQDLIGPLIILYVKWLPLVGWLIYLGIKNHIQPNTRLITLATCLIIGFALLIRNKFAYYMILFTPAIDMLIANVIAELLNPEVLTSDDALKIGLWVGLSLVIGLELPTGWGIVVLGIWTLIVLKTCRSPKRASTLVYGFGLSASVLVFSLFLHGLALWLLPAIDLILLGITSKSFSSKMPEINRYLVTGTTICLFIAATFGGIGYFKFDFRKDYQLTQRRVNEVVHSDDVIMGPQTFWFGLYNHQYYSWEKLVYYRRAFPGSTLEDAFKEFRPTIFITETHLKSFVASADMDENSLYGKFLTLPAEELKTFLARYAELIADFDGGIYGPVQVYRIHWEP